MIACLGRDDSMSWASMWGQCWKVSMIWSGEYSMVAGQVLVLT
jgi:hypothetical protein